MFLFLQHSVRPCATFSDGAYLILELKTHSMMPTMCDSHFSHWEEKVV